MEYKVEQRVPQRDVEKSEAHDCEAHYRTSRESDSQALVEALLSGAGCTVVGSGRDAHSDESGKSREEASCDERERYIPCQLVCRGHSAEHAEHDYEKDEYRAVLALQESACSGTDKL